MGDVIARQALALQQIQPPLAVSQSPEPIAMNGAVEGIRTGCLAKVSATICNQNTALGAEGFRWNEVYQSAHNSDVKERIALYIKGLLGSAHQAEQHRTSSGHNARRHAKHKHRCDAFRMHQAHLQESYSGGEALLRPEYMSDEETDDKYDGAIGKRVLVRKPQWRNEKANELLCLLDELNPPSDATRLLKVVGDVRVIALSSDEQQRLEG